MFVSPLGSSGTPVTPSVSAVTLSGATISSLAPGVVSAATLWIIHAGSMWKNTTNGGAVRLSEATDWIIPNADADSSYEVRYTNHVGDPIVPVTALSVEGYWVDLSESRYLSIVAAPGALFRSCTFDLQIRKDGGAVLATGSYELTAEILL